MAESIVVRIRWFGIAMGYVLARTRTGLHDPWAVRAALDTAFYQMGEVLFERRPLFVSSMESTFIALLCDHDTGLNGPFRGYDPLSPDPADLPRPAEIRKRMPRSVRIAAASFGSDSIRRAGRAA